MTLFSQRTSGDMRIRTIIDAHTRVIGDIELAGDAMISGYVKGNVTASGEGGATLIITREGRVDGSILVPHLVLNGVVDGEACATELLELGAHARVMGDARYTVLQMAMGAEIIGGLMHLSQEPAVSSIATDRERIVA